MASRNTANWSETSESSLAMQIELFDRQRWRTSIELAIAIADYIENFYNPRRRHSSIGYLTPNEFEDLHSTNTQTTSP
jgi:putative transposase